MTARAPWAVVALAVAACAAPLRAQRAPLAAGDTAGGLATPVTVTLRDVPLAAALRAVADSAGVRLVLDPSLAGLDRRVALRAVREPAAALLLRALGDAPVRALVSPAGQVVLAPRVAPGSSRARIGGAVRTPDGAPIEGARVELVGTRVATLSRDDGGFSLGRLPAGRHRVRATRVGFRPLEDVALVVGDDGAPPLALRMETAPVPLSAVVVTPGAFGALRSGLAGTATISRQRFETVPHFDDDAYRAATRLVPGLAAGDFASRFTVRGGPAEELYVTLDGLELAEPYHLQDIEGGLSLLDVNVIGGMELATGGVTAEYGDRLTGVLTMRTVDPAVEGPRTSLGISMLNARATTRGTFADGRGGWLASVRRGYLDLILRAGGASDSLHPTFHDAFAKVQRDLPRLGRVAAHVLYAADRMTYLDDDDPSLRSRYGSAYAWATWEGDAGPALRQRTVASLGRLEWARDGEQDAFDRVVAEADDRRRYVVAGVRQDWQWTLAPRALLKFGGEARRERAAYDYDGWVADVRVDRASGTRRFVPDTIAVDARPGATRLSAYLAPRVQPLPAITLEAGVRVDRVTPSSDGAPDDGVIVSPRLNASWQAARGTTVRAAWGRYAQSQPLHTLQAADGVSRLAAAERAEQRVLGVEQAAGRGVTVRLEGYERRLWRQRPRYVNWTAATSLFPEIAFDRLELRPGDGRARGVELLVTRAGGTRTDWSAGYALSSAADRLQGRDVPRAMDQRHALRGDWSVHPARGQWRLSLAGSWHTGWPYTPTLVAVDTVADTPTRLDLQVLRAPGAIRSGRLPAYRRLDARWTRYVDTRRGRLTLFAEVYNVLDARNVRGYFTDVDVSGRRVSFRPGASEWLPRLPAVGATWEF